MISRSSYGNGFTGRYFWSFFAGSGVPTICELGIGIATCEDGGSDIFAFAFYESMC